MNIITNIIGKIQNAAIPFSYKISAALSPGAVKLFASFFMIWFLWQVIYNGMLKGDIKFVDVIKNLMLFSCVMSALRYSDIFKNMVIKPLMDLVNGLIVTILKQGLGDRLIKIGSGVKNVDGMSYAIDQCLTQIINIYRGINHGVNFLNPDALVAGFFLVIPYLILAGMFACYVLEYILKVATITAVSPLLLICLAFPPTKSAFWGGIKMMAQGALNLILAVFAMTLVLDLVHDLAGNLPLLKGSELWKAAGNWVWSEDYWACVVVGGIACLFLGKTPTIASSIAGVAADSSAAAAIVSGAGAGMAIKGLKGFGSILIPRKIRK